MRQTGSVPLTDSVRRPVGLPITLLVTGAIGLLASLALTLDKIALLENPNVQLGCNFSVLIGCSDNLNSVQGSVFGFPNPILGLVFWAAVITVGVGMLAGARFAGWFWALFSIGTAAALALVVWFIIQSIFVLRVLCPWCMVTWVVTIPVFFVVVLHTLRSEPVPAPLRRVASVGFFWIPAATLVCYVVIAVLAQVQLDVLGEFF
ncbi:vitamin K epoxide reductase family protein [Terrimesophilobacter mesophilus]|uniref:Vitamin K epoxide reductase family protein n=1 Tax=Terrimesophilobacter mesophilus TaxID=433647 RepID=A0A4V3I9N8_9MICO|nr:vitamin K epoxide reductase family protein [Terrimesophilobacter mesophilus]